MSALRVIIRQRWRVRSANEKRRRAWVVQADPGFPLGWRDLHRNLAGRTGGQATSGWRIGIGHDTHRLGPGQALRLGGVSIPHDRALVGHSDADVLLHAITDALLGAAGLGDIGEFFPDTDPAHLNRDSAEMLRHAVERVLQAGYEIANLDCIVFAERPRLTPFKDQLRGRIAGILGIDPRQVGLKAKTGEQIGAVGREEAIMAECVALVRQASRPPTAG